MNKYLVLIFATVSLGLAILAPNSTLVIANASTTNCYGGECWTTACVQNSDCQVGQPTTSMVCQQNSVYEQSVTRRCYGPGSRNAYCGTATVLTLKTNCGTGQMCSNGACTAYNQGGSSTNTNTGSTGTETGTSTTNYGGQTTPTTNNYPTQPQNPSPSQNPSAVCISQSYKSCSGNSIYWFDSCNNQQGLYQTCAANQVCAGNICITNNQNYVFHSTKMCVQNASYWYDSSSNQQDLYQNCSLVNQTCQNGECASQTQQTQQNQGQPTQQNQSTQQSSGQQGQPTQQNQSTIAGYVQHQQTQCYNNDLYWYDSSASVQDLYQSCQDQNSCTIDTCSSNQCQHELKCDSTTCLAGSSDYIKYCSGGAAVSQNPFINFIKKWYLWIIVFLVLTFLFFIIFKRLSSSNPQ